MDVPIASSAFAICAGAGRLVYVWIRGRTQVQLERSRQSAISQRVGTLTPGSSLAEWHGGGTGTTTGLVVRAGLPNGATRG